MPKPQKVETGAKHTPGLVGWLERLDENPGEVVGTRDALERAKEMLNALRAIAAWDKDDEGSEHPVAIARAALAKAEGVR